MMSQNSKARPLFNSTLLQKGEIMKKLIGFLVCCFIVVLFSGCAEIVTGLVIAELEDRANEKGRQNIRKWVTNNIPAGASKDDILQRLDTPPRKGLGFWIYPVPVGITKNLKSSKMFVVIFFSDEKVVTWLGYEYRGSSLEVGSQPSYLEVGSQPSYKDVTLGISKEAISVEKDELAYKGKDVWLLWKAAKVKYDFWGGPGTEQTMTAIIFQNENVAVIFSFRGYNYYSENPNVSPHMLLMPEK